MGGRTPARLRKAAYPSMLRRVNSLRYRARPVRLLWNLKVMANEVAGVSSCERGTTIPWFPISDPLPLSVPLPYVLESFLYL